MKENTPTPYPSDSSTIDGKQSEEGDTLADSSAAGSYLEVLIREDLQSGRFTRPICTRFPPEPNGYLHIGSAYAIHTSYTAAHAFGGVFHLRFDDTNPLKEDIAYVESILKDIEWLGYSPKGHVYYGSDYSEQIFDAAIRLIERGRAYVCDLSSAELAASRGTLTEPGTDSPFRNRTPEENLRLFAEMRNGKYPDASRVLRAKIDMASPNINLRDPVLYRIIHTPHYRTGDAWCIFPMYDFAHPIQDAIEGITHSLCSIEFKDHRPLYEWVLNELEISEPPRQWEFGRVNIAGAVTSKRYLRQLVGAGLVDGWDDPRLPTISGMRRRGFTPESIRSFISSIGLARQQTIVDLSLLEHKLRQDLKESVPAVMTVIDPLKVVIVNFPEDDEEVLTIENNPANEKMGKRKVPFSRELFIEREDFMESPVKGFHRLSPGAEVRLKGAYFIRCVEIIREIDGTITEIRCTYDPKTKSGSGFTERKVKGTIHWVSARHVEKCELRLYDSLLLPDAEIGASEDGWEACLNPDSLQVVENALIEPGVRQAKPGSRFQFIRNGYFILDSVSRPADGKLVFNRIVPLKDGWKK
ncbi:glutamine--tRNA ligase/YqeY domain fusion protein [Paenibacillus sp. URB8-2]|uniref:glutamine--tRNA ligase/YqeY domain fusion protein n=1 Tax=Paenibacillus sp. URB8-2 TaxID=2741301 RepID=UPI0015B8054F|nr:glutamine--tRNA ligase/YqeY domain fusion protein [Paenibacillus sp. URB8-2]BCG59055.1 glutamine--tRNA ligase [Paenibacillus sp. URB8-2]